MKRLFKSQTDKKLCGVCSGLAEYFNLDVSLIRVGWVVLSCMAGAGVLAYIVCALIVPEKPENN